MAAAEIESAVVSFRKKDLLPAGAKVTRRRQRVTPTKRAIPKRRTFTTTDSGWVMTPAAPMPTIISTVPGSMAISMAALAAATFGI